MENSLQVLTHEQTFEHDQFGELRVRYDDNGNVEVNLEDAARGLGFVQVHKERVTTSGYSYAAVRWDRVKGYLADVGYTGEVSKYAYIPESTFYRLAMKANNPVANKFQDWIANEVVPSIRKHGAYLTPEKAEEIISDPDFIIKLAQQVKAERAKVAAAEARAVEAEARAVIAEERVAELAPKADYCDAALKSNETLTVRQIAQDYGMTPQQFNKLLVTLGIQHKYGDTWYICQPYTNEGWVTSRTYNFTRSDGTPDSKTRTVWTQKGKHGIRELLKDHGYFPLNEADSDK